MSTEARRRRCCGSGSRRRAAEGPGAGPAASGAGPAAGPTAAPALGAGTLHKLAVSVAAGGPEACHVPHSLVARHVVELLHQLGDVAHVHLVQARLRQQLRQQQVLDGLRTEGE